MLENTNSDLKTTIQTLKEIVAQFIQERDWQQFHTPKDLALALSVEAAELLELFRFKSNEEITALLKDRSFLQKVSFELVDILYFILVFSNNLEIDLSTTFLEKHKIWQKNYPISLAKGKNLKYTQLKK